MLALASVWIGLGTILLAASMLLYRPAFTDVTVTLVLYFGSPGAMCLGGMVLWAHRKERSPDSGVASRRLQAKIAVILAGFAAAIVYLIIAHSQVIEESPAKVGRALTDPRSSSPIPSIEPV